MTTDQDASRYAERRLQELLLYPREDLYIEYKAWLDLETNVEHRADLAKAMLALANHGGGFVVIGFGTRAGRLVPADDRPADLRHYSQDIVSGIVARYADPTFQCGVYHVQHPTSGQVFPIVTVPGGHKVPIRALRSGPHEKHVQKDRYYIRRPGPASEPPQTAREWNELIQRCVRMGRDELLEALRRMMESGLPSQEPNNDLSSFIEQSRAAVDRILPDDNSPYARGQWTIAYAFQAQLHPTLLEFKSILADVSGHETGWPPWWVPTRDDIAPYVSNGAIECSLISSKQEPGQADFWRASPDVRMFLLRGYQEDGTSDLQPGTVLDRTLPVWRVGECLLHAKRLADRVQSSTADITFHVSWQGLRGRRLVNWATKSRPLETQWNGSVSREDMVASGATANAETIEEDLTALVATLTRPLYECFGFYELPNAQLAAELNKMRSGR